jgi:hypothetical protein
MSVRDDDERRAAFSSATGFAADRHGRFLVYFVYF